MSVDLKKYDIHYQFNERSRRGEIQIFEKFSGMGDERRLIGIVYKSSVDEKTWAVSGSGSTKDHYSPHSAVLAAIELDLDIKQMILQLRKEMGQKEI